MSNRLFLARVLRFSLSLFYFDGCQRTEQTMKKNKLKIRSENPFIEHPNWVSKEDQRIVDERITSLMHSMHHLPPILCRLRQKNILIYGKDRVEHLYIDTSSSVSITHPNPKACPNSTTGTTKCLPRTSYFLRIQREGRKTLILSGDLRWIFPRDDLLDSGEFPKNRCSHLYRSADHLQSNEPSAVLDEPTRTIILQPSLVETIDQRDLRRRNAHDWSDFFPSRCAFQRIGTIVEVFEGSNCSIGRSTGTKRVQRDQLIEQLCAAQRWVRSPRSIESPLFNISQLQPNSSAFKSLSKKEKFSCSSSMVMCSPTFSSPS